MNHTKTWAGFVIGLLLIPFAASAQSISLSVQAKAQLLTLAQQLVQIMSELAQARLYGEAYLASQTFAQQASGWTTRLAQIQQQVTVVLATAIPMTPTYPAYPSYPTGSFCPSLSRDLEPPMQGNDVYELQQFLARVSLSGYSGSATGIFDNATLLAVQRFQSAYGLISYGDFLTTGFGRVGPGTRAMIRNACNGLQPSPTPYPTYPTPQTPVAMYSTGTLSVTRATGQGQNTMSFTVTGAPVDGCKPTVFTLDFGDGIQQQVNFPASCNTQTQTITHTYQSMSGLTARLTSGTFQAAVPVTVIPSNYSLQLSAAQDTTSYSVLLTAAFNPGSACDRGAYELDWGDGDDRTITFTNGCSTQTKTYTHQYDSSGQYLIQATDEDTNNVVGISFNATTIQSAGAGDPGTVLNIRGDGSVSDTSTTGKSVSSAGDTHTDSSIARVGSGSVYFDGAGDYLSINSSNDFNFGSGAFTVSMWVRPQTLPAPGTQAAFLIQGNSAAADSSLGGAGLELFGDRVYFVGTIGGTTYHPYYGNAIGSYPLSANTWYHVALVRSGNTVTLYINGVSQGSVSVSGSANASGNALAIGRYGEFNGNYFKGWIDEVQVVKGFARWTGNFDPNTGIAGSAFVPTLSSVSDATISRSQTITITGTNFTSSNVVLLNGASAGIFQSSNNGTTISFTMPSAQPSGSYSLSVSNSNGTSGGIPITVN